MAVLGANRPHASITDTRIMLVADRERLLEELKNDSWTAAQRLELLKLLCAADNDLAHMQIISAKKWKIRRLNAKVNKANKADGRGRKKRLHDSQGNPLYNGVEPLDTNEPDLKTRFLSGLKNENTSDSL